MYMYLHIATIIARMLTNWWLQRLIIHKMRHFTAKSETLYVHEYNKVLHLGSISFLAFARKSVIIG